MAIRIDMFAASFEETKDCVMQVKGRIAFNDSRDALRGLTAVLHALRDELSVAQNAALAAHMPTMLRGIYFEDWRPQSFDAPHTSHQAFLNRVEQALERRGDAPDALELTETVFSMLASRMANDSDEVAGMLPPQIRALWPH